MRYFRDTIKYIGTNFPKLLLFSVVPAGVLAFVGNIWKFVSFFANPNAVQLSFFQIYEHFSFLFGNSISLGVVGFFVISFFASLAFSAIERHMKIGKFSLSRPFARVDETILAVLPVFFFVVCGAEICALLASVLILAGALISKTVAIVVSVFSVLALVISVTFLVVQTLFWAPSMIVLGYPLKSALIFSMNTVSGRSGYVFKQFVATFAVAALVAGFAYVFLAPYISSFTNLFNFVIYLLAFMFIISYCMVAFFDVTEEARNDLKKTKKYLT